MSSTSSIDDENYILYDDLIIVKQLATGGSKKIILCKYNNNYVILNNMIDHDDHDINIIALNEFNKEINILKELAYYNNIVKIIGVIKNKYSFITEYCQLGSLHSLIKLNKLTFQNKIMIYKAMARTMNFLHTLPSPLLHGDLSSSNILITENFVPKLCDFGLSRIQYKTLGITKKDTERGTVCFMAPELLRDQEEYITIAADVWSFAMVGIELFGKLPYGSFHEKARIFQIANDNLPPELSAVEPRNLQDFLKTLLVPAAKRPSFASILTTLRVLFPPLSYPEDESESDNVTLDDIRRRRKDESSKDKNLKPPPIEIKAVKPQVEQKPKLLKAVSVPAVAKIKPKAIAPKEIIAPKIPVSAIKVPTIAPQSASKAKRKHSGFWEYPPMGQIKGKWSCCGCSSYHETFCIN